MSADGLYGGLEAVRARYATKLDATQQNRVPDPPRGEATIQALRGSDVINLHSNYVKIWAIEVSFPLMREYPARLRVGLSGN